MFSKDEFRKFENYCFKKKGDALMINMRLPYRYHLIRDLNIKEVFFSDLKYSMLENDKEEAELKSKKRKRELPVFTKLPPVQGDTCYGVAKR